MKSKKSIFIINFHSGGPNLQKGKSIHESLKWVLVLAQFLGQMPIIGITNPDPKFLKFTWKSWRCLYCIVYIICTAVLNIFYLNIILVNGFNFFLANAFAFLFSTLIITLLFMKLASEWFKIMRKWSLVEYSMRSYGHPLHLSRRIGIMASVVLGLAMTEHFIVKIKSMIITYKCKGSTDFFEFYFTTTLYPEIFIWIGSYSLWMAIPLQIISLQLTFAWTFNDLFIMLLSTALALRFQQITSRLKMMKKNWKSNSNIEVWREIREDYNRLSTLTKHLDNSLSYIILISFANNLYFVLVQIFNSLRITRDTVEKVYFFFSFGFLIMRIICVCIYGAWIYDESREPMPVLNSIPSNVYNIEIKRFIEQIKFDTVALTGKKFFYITRGLILSMAGAVVTYELVLIQFNGNVLRDSAQQANQTPTC